MERLLEPLRQDRGAAAEQILRHKLTSLIGQALDYLRVALAAATQAEASRQALHDRLLEERGAFDALREELYLLAHDVAGQALEQSVQRLQPVARTLQAEVTAGLEAQLGQWRLRLPRLLEAWRAWLNDFLGRELSEVSQARRGMFCEPLHKACERLTRVLRAFQDRLAEYVKAALGVALTRREFALEVREPSAPPVDVSYAFDAAFTTMGWLIPLTLFRQPIERVLLRKARWEVQKNLSRLAADWQTRVSAGVQELRRQAEQYALNELTTLEQMLAQGQTHQPQLREVILELESFRAQLAAPACLSETPRAIENGRATR